VISIYKDEGMGEPFVQPDQGTVAFASGLHGWYVTLATFTTTALSSSFVSRSLCSVLTGASR